MDDFEIKFLKKLKKNEVLSMIIECKSVCMVDEYEDEDYFDINEFIDLMYAYLKKYKKDELIKLYVNEDKLQDIISEVVKNAS